MNTDDWNSVLDYAESFEPQTMESSRKHAAVLVRFRQWLREAEISHPGFTARPGNNGEQESGPVKFIRALDGAALNVKHITRLFIAEGAVGSERFELKASIAGSQMPFVVQKYAIPGTAYAALDKLVYSLA